MDCLAKGIEVFLAIARFLLEIRDPADVVARHAEFFPAMVKAALTTNRNPPLPQFQSP
jgi:hypothetical protein